MNPSLAIFYFQKNFIVLAQQRYCIKFFQKLGNTHIETIRKIQQVFADVAAQGWQSHRIEDILRYLLCRLTTMR